MKAIIDLKATIGALKVTLLAWRQSWSGVTQRCPSGRLGQHRSSCDAHLPRGVSTARAGRQKAEHACLRQEELAHCPEKMVVD